MERLRPRQPRRLGSQIAHHASAAGPDAPETPDVTPGVQIIWGPMTERMNVEGMTVEAVYRLLQTPFNIAPGVVAQVNGRDVTSSGRQLVAGDTLEFVKPAGEKG